MSRTGKVPVCYIDVFLGRNMPENFGYVRILQMIADPRRSLPRTAFRGEDDEGRGCGDDNARVMMKEGLRCGLFFRGLPFQLDHFLLRELGDCHDIINGIISGKHRKGDFVRLVFAALQI